MKLRTHHYLALVGTGLIAVGGIAWLTSQSQPALATCPTGTTITIASPQANATINGTVQLGAQASASSPTQPSSVTFSLSAPTAVVLGNGSPVTSGSVIGWQYNWNTTTVADGSYQLVATAHFGTNSAADCSSAVLPLVVHNNTTQPSQSLVVTVAPVSVTVAAGGKVSLTAAGSYIKNGSSYPLSTLSGVSYAWNTNAGTVTSATTPATVLVAGTKAGTYAAGVTVTYQGLTQSAVANVTVTVPPVATPITGTTTTPSSQTGTPATPTTTSTDTSTLIPQQVQLLTTTPSVFRPTTATNSDPVVPVTVLACLEQNLGTEYNAISSGQTQPTSDDRTKSATCFSGNTLIPAALAPVAPTHITEVPQDQTLVSVSGVKNTTFSSSGTKKVGIQVSGTGKPNSDIFIYVFSDPMVLRAQTDGQGKWSYVLENPLKPGHHEIYAVSAKDSTSFVRSSAIPVTVAAAASGTQDGSLIIQSGLQSAQVAYIGGGLLLIILSLFITLRLRGARAPQPVAASPVATVAVPVAAPTPSPAPSVVMPTPASPANPVSPPVVTPPPPEPPHDPQV